MKKKALAKQYLHDFIPFIWYGIIVAIVYILFALLTDVNTASTAATIKEDLKETFVLSPYLITLVTMLGISFNYHRFQVALQNGVSRKTFWKAKMLFIIKAAFLVNVVNVFLGLLNVMMGHEQTYAYYQLFGKAFSNMFLQSIFMFITDYVVLLFIFIAMNTFGTIASLMNRIGKSIFYSIGVVFYIFFTNLLTQYGSQKIISKFYARINGEAILNFIFGVDRYHSKPFALIGVFIILSIIAAGFNLLFTRLEQVKR